MAIGDLISKPEDLHSSLREIWLGSLVRCRWRSTQLALPDGSLPKPGSASALAAWPTQTMVELRVEDLEILEAGEQKLRQDSR